MLTDPLLPIPIAVFVFVHVKLAPEGVLVKLCNGIESPGQKYRFETTLVSGVGLIVTVKIMGVPGQPAKVGVTVIVPTTFIPVILAGAVQLVILPFPETGFPILVLEFVHAKLAPLGLLVNVWVGMISPGQTIILLN